LLCSVRQSCFFVYKIVDPVTCTAFSFSSETITPRKDDALFKKEEAISFKSSVNNENITWDFGDNTDNQQGRIVTHRFSKDGSFTVKARLNSVCESVQTITIAKDPVRVIVPIAILGPDSTIIGNDITFSCPDPANSYDWVVKDHPEIINTGTGSMAKYKFLLPGPYTILVTLNRDITKTGVKPVNVILKPVKQPTVTNIPSIPECALPIETQDFLSLLVKVMHKELQSGNFSQYLCKGDNTPVLVNGKQTFVFSEFCQKLSNISESDKGKISITVQLDRMDEKIKGTVVKNAVQKISVGLTRKKDRFILKDKTVLYELK
jgi:PKD domain